MTDYLEELLDRADPLLEQVRRMERKGPLQREPGAEGPPPSPAAPSGGSEPVATVPGQAAHVIELTRIYATDEAIRDGVDFYSMKDFSLVICKPDKKIIYSDCQWSAIQESASIGSMVLEKVTLVASRRIETGV